MRVGLSFLKSHWLFFVMWTALAVATAAIMLRGAVDEAIEEAPIAVARASSGEVNVRSESLLLWRAIQSGQGFQEGDRLATGVNGQVSVELFDGRRLELGEDSLVIIDLEPPDAKGQEEVGELVLVVTVAKGKITVLEAPASIQAGGRASDRQGRPSRARRTAPSRPLEVRVDGQAISLKKSDGTVRIDKPSDGRAARVEASSKVLATSRASAPLAPAVPGAKPVSTDVPPPLLVAKRVTEQAPTPTGDRPPEELGAEKGAAAVGTVAPADHAPEIELLGRRLGESAEVWVNAAGQARGARLAIRLSPPPGRAALPGAWLPFVEIDGERIFADEGREAHELSLQVPPLPSQRGVDLSTKPAYTLRLKRGVRIRSMEQVADFVDSATHTISIRSVEGAIRGGAQVWLDMGGARMSTNAAFLLQDRSLGSDAHEGIWKIELADAQDLPLLWSLMQRSRSMRVEAGQWDHAAFEESAGVWMVREHSLRARLIVGKVASSDVDSILADLRGDLVFQGPAQFLIRSLRDAAKTERFWVANRARGERGFWIEGDLAARSAGVASFVERAGAAFFRRPVSILSIRRLPPGSTTH